MAIKAIIFDCFGVLVTSSEFKLKHDYPQSTTQIDDIRHQFDYALISLQQFKDSLAKLLGLTADDVDSRYLKASVHDDAAVKWVRELKESGQYKTGTLSNVGHGIFEYFFDSSAQKELFDAVVLSCDVGMAKPDIMIFGLIAKRLGVSTSECVMIDDMPINIDAALNAGMQGIVFIPTDQAQDELRRLLESDRA